MNIKTRSSPHKKAWLIISAIILTLLLSAGIIYAILNKSALKIDTKGSSSTVNTVNYSGPTAEQSNPTIDSQGSAQSDTTDTLDVTITSANQNSGVLQVRSLVTPLIGVGTCALRLERSGYTSIVKTASTQNLSSSSTCQGFDIPIATLSSGAWAITLTVTSAGTSGKATSEVTIE